MVKNNGFVSNFFIISRAKLQMASLPHAALGIFLGAAGLGAIISWSVLVYVLLVFALITFACNLNCLYDFKVDRKYKKYMSSAVEAIGFGRLRLIVFLEFILIVFLLSILWLRGHHITVFISLLGLFAAISYSVEPLRIKKRGILSPLPVFIGFYALSVLGGWFLLNTMLPLYFMVFVVGYALINEGVTLINTCEDYSEDGAEGIKTWAHVFGLKKTLSIAFIFTFFGGIFAVSSLLFLLLQAHVSITWLISLVLIILSTVITIKISVEIRNVGMARDLEASAKRYAKKMPSWFMTTRYPLFFAALFLLL